MAIKVPRGRQFLPGDASSPLFDGGGKASAYLSRAGQRLAEAQHTVLLSQGASTVRLASADDWAQFLASHAATREQVGHFADSFGISFDDFCNVIDDLAPSDDRGLEVDLSPTSELSAALSLDRHEGDYARKLAADQAGETSSTIAATSSETEEKRLMGGYLAHGAPLLTGGVPRRTASGRVLEMPARSPTRAGALEGHLDRIENAWVLGWAWHSGRPGAPVEVEVLLDGEIVLRAPAAQYRADLERAGKGEGRHAFQLALPEGFRDGRERAVRVRFAGTDADLAGSPRGARFDLGIAGLASASVAPAAGAPALHHSRFGGPWPDRCGAGACVRTRGRSTARTPG